MVDVIRVELELSVTEVLLSNLEVTFEKLVFIVTGGSHFKWKYADLFST